MKENWKNFKKHELVCQHCGEFNPNPEFQTLMDKVQELRDILGFPMGVSSAYRCPNHPIEARKEGGAGEHSLAAIDLKVSYERAFDVMEKAFEMGFTGIGVNQRGDIGQRFIHLDLRDPSKRRVWSYWWK